MPNIKKLKAGDFVYVRDDCLQVTLVDPIQLFVTVTGEDGTSSEYRLWQLWSTRPPFHSKVTRKRQKTKQEDRRTLEEDKDEDKDCSKDCSEERSFDIGDNYFF